jgi:hypothetical protein
LPTNFLYFISTFQNAVFGEEKFSQIASNTPNLKKTGKVRLAREAGDVTGSKAGKLPPARA